MLPKPAAKMDWNRKKQLFAILLLAFSLMFLISLAGHHISDDQMIISDEAVYGDPFELEYVNPGGMMGAYFSYAAMFFLGWGAFPAVFFMLVSSLRILGLDIGARVFKHAALWWGLAVILLALWDVPKVASGRHFFMDAPNGVGALGQTVLEYMIRLVGVPGAYLLLLAALASTLIFYFSISHRFRHLVHNLSTLAKAWGEKVWERAKPVWADMRQRPFWQKLLQLRMPRFKDELNRMLKGRKSDEISLAGSEAEGEHLAAGDDVGSSMVDTASGAPKRKVVLAGKTEPLEAIGEEAFDEMEGSGLDGSFIMPGPELLNEGAPPRAAQSDKELAETARALRETLETFGVRIEGDIAMFPGPVITRFEIRPAAGIKVNQVANLSDDLALNLRAKSIRIIAPVPGKAAVGIEIPNRHPEIVYLRDIITSEAFRQSREDLPLALGKDSAGNPYVTGLSGMPHLLIAGTTGSGKSVCINAIITSLIYKLHPDRLRFIFIDPKMLELSVYRGIPHLHEDVVTDPKQAERVLNDAVGEMESRYRLLAGAAARSIVDYNRKQHVPQERLPYIVIVIDELADMMMSAQSNRVELLITRLAQMARAVGIHLILATQRPSVDVITGLIKANFPSRIAFQVATKIDSRTILDGNGAERLLGNGDMLFLEVGSAEPVRLHGAYISSEETERLVAFFKEQPYSRRRADEAKVAAEEKAQWRPFDDPVLLEAIETVVRQKQASVSLLQRRLGIGYQRAARLIDELEAMKIIGSYNESKAREVLVDLPFLEKLKTGKMSET